MGIEFKEGAVCFADGVQWIDFNNFHLISACANRVIRKDMIHTYCEFQLNTIKQGDCIASSEIDTEQKYSDVVEVFGLFGFVFKVGAVDEYRNFGDAESLTCCDDGLWQTSTDRWNERKLTYTQLMAIGELKRLEIEKSAPKMAPDLTPDLANKQEVKMQKNKPVVAQVMIDLTERMEMGIKTYGEALRANNGRDALQDAYEEALDLACYLKQAMIERDNENTN